MPPEEDDLLEDLQDDPPNDPPAEGETDESEDEDASEGDTDEGEPEDGETDGEQPRQARSSTRENDRVRSLKDQLAERDRRLDDLNRRLDDSLRTRSAPAQQTETTAQRAERLALLTPQERMELELRESESRHANLLQNTVHQLRDQSDRTAFELKASSSPLHRKYESKVEAKLAEMRAQGSNAPREVVLKFLIGEAYLSQAASRDGKTRQQARGRVQRERVPQRGSNRSDTGTSRRTGGTTAEARERRLENVNI